MRVSRENVIQFLKNKMRVDTSKINGQTPLFSSGLVDSFGMVELITFLEAEGRIKINAMDVSMENIDSIDRIMSFIDSKVTA